MTRSLRYYVQSLGPPVVGAAHVTCSDEAERECVDAFQRGFVQYLLPTVKFSSRAAFRVANLGGRYEWGAVPIAEDHYALASGAERWKLVLVKLNAHVSVEGEGASQRFGRMDRYGSESVYCGALHGLLDGSSLPFAHKLLAAFELEGQDHLSPLRDPERTEPRLRGLYAAVVNARQQARCAMLDIQDHRPRTPTLYLVVPCVSLNRLGHDTEVVCGIYTADRRGDEPHDEYCGLGDRPERYRLHHGGNGLWLEDDELQRPRRARDHRALVVARYRERGGRSLPEAAPPRLRSALEEAHRVPHSRALLSGLLAVAAEAAPVPLAVLLFGEGLLHIHHASQAHRLAREAEGDEVARAMLAELHGRLDGLTDEEVRHLLALLQREYAK